MVVLISSVNNPIIDLLDILIVTFIIYKLIIFMRNTRAEQLMKGIFVFILAYAVAQLFNLRAVIWIMSLVYINAIVVLVVLFQPELRSVLERLGRSSLKNIGKTLSAADSSEGAVDMIDSVCDACGAMQKKKVGALIVLERKTMLDEIADTGTVVAAKSSKDLICNVFFPKSPLHDGAVIIRDNKLYAAACILPLTQNKSVDSVLGTRHRAAIGVSEISDAIVVVVSEETGTISVATNGIIQRNFTAQTLKEFLVNALIGSTEPEPEQKGFLKILKRKGAKKDEKD
ncbi:MAG: diadenylate cyclase CdaA [Clostridia bacterium]|nr:diadenylate cyclase CdaA [Clostridia bacterium]